MSKGVAVQYLLGCRDDSRVWRMPDSDIDFVENFTNYAKTETLDMLELVKTHGGTMHIKNLKKAIRWIKPAWLDGEDRVLAETLKRLLSTP